MIRLRPYKSCDAEALLGWIPSERRSFGMWCAGHFDYPITIDQLEDYRLKHEPEPSSWCMTAVDDSGEPVGLFLMRLCDFSEGRIHLGFIIVDPAKRGQGLGCEMVGAALRTAVRCRMKNVTLAVAQIRPRIVLLKAGFKDDGILDEKLRIDSEDFDIVRMRAEL